MNRTVKNKSPLFNIIIALILPAIITTIYMLFLKDTFPGNVLLIFQTVWLITWPLILGKPSQIISEIIDSKNNLQAVLSGTVSGIILFVVLFTGYHIFKNDLLQYASAGYGETEFGSLRQLFIVYIIFGCVFNTLIEELYWRRFVFGNIGKRTSVRFAALVSAFFFGIHHYIMLAFIFPIFYVIIIGTLIVAAGFIWNLLYSKYKNILPSWISHAFVVAMLMIIIADVIF